MARPSAEVPPFHNPLEKILHVLHDVKSSIGRNRLIQTGTSLALIITAGAAIDYFILREAPRTPPMQPTAAAGIVPGPEIGGGPVLVPDPTREQPSPTATATKAPPSPTATEKPAPTATNTATATATSTATPEKPKAVYWPLEKIIAEQEKAAKEKHLLLLDTWSAKGATIQEARSYNGHDLIVLDGFQKGDILLAPIGGKITSVYTAAGKDSRGKEFKGRGIDISFQGTELEFIFNWDDEILVKEGEVITTAIPIVKLSGLMLPSQLRISQAAQVSIGKTSRNIDKALSKKNILNENRIPVQAQSALK